MPGRHAQRTTEKPRRRPALALLWLIALLTAGYGLPLWSEPPGPVVAGPMPGHSAMRSVTLWLQTGKPADITVNYWPVAHPEQAQQTPPVKTGAATQGTAHIEVTGLAPGTAYEYQILADGKAQDFGEPLHFKTQALWRWRHEPPDFSVALGSCAFINDAPFDRPGPPWGDSYRIFDTIAAQRPDMMLWLGDALYFREADILSPWGMEERYRQVRQFPALQRLLRSTHHYAIWDDHDYGPNNASRSFIFKDQSLALFKRYWANPSYGLAETPGIFTQASFNDVDFFLLDNRYYRDNDKAPDNTDKTMLGAEQLAWLKDALLASNATFKIIANGSQLINTPTPFEGWHNFSTERESFMDWLAGAHIAGVLFLSGDRHHTELLKVERLENYPLYELTCSPLTSGTSRPRDNDELDLRVPGTLVTQRNFCRLDFSGPRKERVLTLSSYDVDGKPLWQHRITAGELRAAQEQNR